MSMKIIIIIINKKKNSATKNWITNVQCVQSSYRGANKEWLLKKQTNNKFYSILTLKRSFAASIKWFAFRYLNIVKGFTIIWIFVTIIERFLAR